MDRTHEKLVEAQFGSRAKAYVESAVHSQGADLDALEAVIRKAVPARALDLGTGGGHVSYLMARYAATVAAVDLSPEMLAAVARTARDKGLDNIETVEAPAGNLPFENGSFDFLACRYSAHHSTENGTLSTLRSSHPSLLLRDAAWEPTTEKRYMTPNLAFGGAISWMRL